MLPPAPCAQTNVMGDGSPLAGSYIALVSSPPTATRHAAAVTVAVSRADAAGAAPWTPGHFARECRVARAAPDSPAFARAHARPRLPALVRRRTACAPDPIPRSRSAR